MSELTLEQALILLDESREYNAGMLNRLYESLGIDSSDGEIRFKWAMLAIEDIKRERDNALAQNAELVAQVAKLTGVMQSMADSHLEDGETEAAEQFLIHINKTPAQHLRDRDAEAGRAGFLACSQWINDEDDGRHTVTEAGDEYAEKVRKGEV